MSDKQTADLATLAEGPDGVPGSAEAWASGLRGAVLTGLMTSPFAAEAGEIRAVVMRDLYAEVDRIVAAARADERDLRRVLSAYAPGWDGTLPHLVQILSSWPVAQYEADRIRAALDQPRKPPLSTGGDRA